jgi:hypothetical protein
MSLQEGEWLYNKVANRHVQTYVKGFMDISGGDLIVRNGDLNVAGRSDLSGDTVMHQNANVRGLIKQSDTIIEGGFIYREITSNAVQNTLDDLTVLKNTIDAVLTIETINNVDHVNLGTINDKIIIGGDASFNSGLTLDGDASFNSGLTVGGNVGIGTGSPSRTLTMYHPIAPALHLINSSSGTGDGMHLEQYELSTYFTNKENGNIYIRTQNDNIRMTILEDGNVGIGTTSPGREFTLYDASYPSFQMINPTTGTGAGDGFQIQVIGNDAHIINKESGKLNFRTNDTERMTINSSGNVGIGTTAPYATLHINGVYNAGLVNMTTRNWIKYSINSTDVQRNTNTVGLSASIYASGDIVTNSHLISSAISGTSDRRIKQNIVDIDDGSALETLRLLKPKKYEYIDTFSKTQSVVWGFIAQEVAETLPYATHTGKREIPNIYQVANVSNINHLTFATDIQLEYDASGSLVNDLLLYDASDNRIDATIKEVVSATEIRIESEITVSNEVFVYGQKVDDFHYLDKHAIFTVATSALQEVDRQLQAEKTKVATLETQLADVLTRLAALESA